MPPASDVFIGVAIGHRDAVAERLVFRAPHHVAEEGVLAVEHDEADRGAGAGAKLAGGVVAHVPELFDGAVDAADRIGGDIAGAVQDVGDGTHAHAPHAARHRGCSPLPSVLLSSRSTVHREGFMQST